MTALRTDLILFKDYKRNPLAILLPPFYNNLSVFGMDVCLLVNSFFTVKKESRAHRARRLPAHEMEEMTMAPIYIMINQEETGRNILDLMHRQGLKVRDIQEACGFEQPQAVYKWIHGQSLPSIDNLLILAKLFGSTVEGILATSGDAFPHMYKESEVPIEGINYYRLLFPHKKVPLFTEELS